MAETLNPYRKRGTLNAIPNFKCKECKGKAYHDSGRVRVAHRQDCAIFLRMALTHPQFFTTLEMYRSTNGN